MSATQLIMLGEGAGGGPVTYIEDVFSTYLYTGTGSAQTITNGIDLSTKGGLVWTKSRSNSANSNLVDTARGADSYLISNSTVYANSFTGGGDTAFSFGTTGYTTSNFGNVAQSALNFVSWTFRKQPKFFDVQTATTNGSSSYGSTVPSMTIAHSLGSVPGCVLVKRIDDIGEWYVWHRSLPALSGLAQTATYARLNTTGAAAIFGGNVNGTGGWIQATSTTIYLDAWFNTYEPGTFVVYIFAHDAGGFGLTGTDNVISCGSYTASGSSGTVTLGYEPQWILIKNSDGGASGIANWVIVDNMRGMPVGSNDNVLYPNSSSAEVSSQRVAPTATGFSVSNASGNLWDNGAQYIYIAIRRGPMKVPTSGTSVFGLNARSGTGADVTVTAGQTDDVAVIKARSTGQGALWAARLTATGYAQSSATSAIAAAGTTILQANPWDVMDGVKVGTTSAITNASTATYINYLFKRAPSFMDVVCYEGIDPSIEHNLGVTPEMYIVKSRSNSGLTGGRWYVYHTGYDTSTNYIALNTTDALTAATIWGSGPTPSVIGATGGTKVNEVGQTYIAYLFATLAGVSKVGSYTGTGALQTINCGFTGGARFVLIKRTDSTGDWYTYDSARGLSSSTDPYFFMNTSSAETTGTNYVDTDSTGFKVTAAAPAELNASGGNYIFLAIA